LKYNFQCNILEFDVHVTVHLVDSWQIVHLFGFCHKNSFTWSSNCRSSFNPEFHYHVQKNQLSPLHIVLPCFHKTHFHIILPFVFGSPCDVFSSCLPTKIICNFLPSVCHIMPAPSHAMLMVQFTKTSCSQYKIFHFSIAWYLLSPNTLLISLSTSISVLPLEWNTKFQNSFTSVKITVLCTFNLWDLKGK